MDERKSSLLIVGSYLSYIDGRNLKYSQHVIAAGRPPLAAATCWKMKLAVRIQTGAFGLGQGCLAMEQHNHLYRVVQPWGRDRATQSTLISEHLSAVQAFAAIDALAEQMMRTGSPSNAVEFIVIDPGSRIVNRPES